MKISKNGFIDIHCHILPHVDDGSKNMQMSIEMLEIAYREGIREIVATPHYHPGRPKIKHARIMEQYEKFKKEVIRRHPDMTLHLGREVYYTSDILKEIEQGSPLSMVGSHYILVEYSPSTEYSYIRASIYNLLQAGLLPIIAHVERYKHLAETNDYVHELKKMGAFIQINSASVMGKTGIREKIYVRKLLKMKYVDFISTDAHSVGTRAPYMRKCSMYVAKKYGQDYADKLLKDNPKIVIEGIKLEEVY